jgi:hypothetical protein
MKTIDEQTQAMASQWPGFKLTEREDDCATWEGVLAPDKRKHLIRVRYCVPTNVLENVSLRLMQPRVRVIDPLLELHHDYEQGPIPHVYWSKEYPTMPSLCLFSPTKREWTPDDLIADTTIFWACEWLYFYEGWLVTKKWHGGGQHPQQEGDGTKRLETV